LGALPDGPAKLEVTVGGRTLIVYSYKPATYRGGPMLMVFHGLARNAEAYRDYARPLADRRGLLVVAPEFDEGRFPYEKYTRGGILDGDGVAPRGDWIWSAVRKLADEVRRREGRPDLPYYLLGHSAGGQFVARLTGFVETGAVRHVAANPGAHLAPDREDRFPYGFGGLPDGLGDDAAIRSYLARPLTICLGEADDRRDDDLDTSPEADRQGRSRVERGRNVFEGARWLARRKGWAFNWRLVTGPGVGHDARAMLDSPACEEALFGPDRSPTALTNSVGMRLVRIPAGRFLMGMPDTPERLAEVFPRYRGRRIAELDDMAPHEVHITRSFYMGAHEVTIGQYRRFVEETGYLTEPERDGTGGYGVDLATKAWSDGRRKEYSWRDPGFPQRDDHPVVNITWADAVAFCRWLSRKEGRTYRLPTEAEWEYACRAGSTTRYSFGDDPELLPKYANTYDASSAREFPEWAMWAVKGDDGYPFTAPVGSFLPNAFGLYDMHGNAWEWCSDWYGEDYYTRSPVEDPQGPETGTRRARRGGGWHVWPMYCQSWYRNYNTPQSRYLNLGLRVVLEAEPPR
jgi:formylglycine-generating enzyme required for sulfatase activity